ncbi:MAG: GNAT family N-acetyltransferase [Chitinophagaceae bacterium]|nr:GNAT family N-acetyltransferase [Chitinophagaceae bacterium]
MLTTTWNIKKFTELNVEELYAILQLRNIVFAVEQKCIYEDMDNRDQPSAHLMGWVEDKLAAYARILPPGVAFPEVSIGRVVTSPDVRGKGLGKELMKRALDYIRRQYGVCKVTLGAQLYLKRFYESFGFKPCSEVYLEDGIPHIVMIYEFPEA